MTENKALEERESEQPPPDERRCTHVFPDGRRCKQRRWQDKELCFQHAPEAAELRNHTGRRVSALRVLTATEVHERLSRTLAAVEAGRMPVGRAYAVGYLAQLLLGNLKAVGQEYDSTRTQWDRYQEIYWRVRALDEGTYFEFKKEEAQEVKEAEPVDK